MTVLIIFSLSSYFKKSTTLLRPNVSQYSFFFYIFTPKALLINVHKRFLRDNGPNLSQIEYRELNPVNAHFESRDAHFEARSPKVVLTNIFMIIIGSNYIIIVENSISSIVYLSITNSIVNRLFTLIKTCQTNFTTLT